MTRALASKYVLLDYSRLTVDFINKCSTCCQAKWNLNFCVGSLPATRYFNERVFIDNAQFGQLHFCTLVEHHSNLIFARPVKDYSSKHIIHIISKYIESYGIPDLLLSDNHRPLISKEMNNFLFSKGIIHLTSIKYRSTSNGQAEKAFQTIKQGLRLSLSLSDSVKRFNLSMGTDGINALTHKNCEESKENNTSYPFKKLDTNDQIYKKLFKFKFAIASNAGCKREKAVAAILFKLNDKEKTILKLDEIRTVCGPATKAQLLEVLAVKNAIELFIKNKLEIHEIVLIIDSIYAASKVEEVFKWQENEFRKYDGTLAKHIDTWRDIYDSISKNQLKLHIIKITSLITRDVRSQTDQDWNNV
ncbi:Integrase, catalytic core domain and Ribonuclease H-like domain-containing protein [Strongyloides ratti]|uniref:Integrase, catalytic core domain and Ribonuclease H-like domain-containing protein n=1 Tax=Strongyloides ratti TaxID=34506 RepID=A0A090KZZ7_STRRB|nr:Integrase, catalytic core domain and Ribonuclease H-like domain-containing protein [Strongyloides ratti]CEF61457.1 Integrase, catalytic core domain and Ribonuclease H-like domain-containing protein [Strongyloides ratti]